MNASSQPYTVYASAAGQHAQTAQNINQIHASMNESSWPPSHHDHSTPTTCSASAQPSPLFPVVNRDSDLDYPSPVPSITSSPYHCHQQAEQYIANHHTSALNPNNTILSPFTQVESSIGPSRVLTRRQRAALEQNILARRASMPTNFQRPEPPSAPRHNSAMYLTTSLEKSRPQTPNNEDVDQFQSQRDRLSLNIASAIPLQMQSPSYHPMTPTSLSSPFSPYNMFQGHSRSTSSSNSNNQRAASPALSNASALTSVSSSASGHNTQTFATYPRPTNNGISALAPRPKQRKQRLFNVDRKAICLYHKQYPNARQEDIAMKYGVERSTISKILKHKTKWLNVPEHENNRIAKHRPSKFPEIEEELMQWLEECSKNKVVLSDSLIRNKAKETAKTLHISEEKFKASSGWVENFKHRHGIRAGIWSGAAKNIRMARGLGSCMIGAGDPALSPLNPAFDGRSEALCEMGTGASMDYDSDDSAELDDEGRASGEGISQSMGLQPPWPEHNNNDSSTPLMNQAEPAQLPVMQESLVHHHQCASTAHLLTQHTSETDRQSQMHDEAPYDPPPVYEGNIPLYQHVPNIPDNTPPTLADAEEAINKLITFLDSTGRGILQDSERQALNTIKCALFQAGSGIPFDRTRQ